MESIGTTAGYKDSYSYNKLIQVLVQMLTEPDKAFIMGGTWRIPVVVGLQSKHFMSDLKKDGTFDATGFDQEYKRFVLIKLLRIAGKSLEPYKLQRNYEIKVSVNV